VNNSDSKAEKQFIEIWKKNAKKTLGTHFIFDLIILLWKKFGLIPLHDC
jgi:hypothetical protein